MMPSGPPWEVVHCVFSVAMGGQELVILSLASRANRERFSPRVLCLQAAGELAPRFEAHGIPVDVLDPPVGGSSLRALQAFKRYLGARRPAILHTHNPMPHQYGAIVRLVAPVPVLVHTKHGRNVLRSAKARWLERLAGRLTDAVVPVSDDTAEIARTRDRVPSERIRVIRNGVDLGNFGSHCDRSPTYHVVHVARLNTIKDQTTLLHAARLVADAEPRFRLDVVGDGEKRPSLEALSQQLHLGEVVTFHGQHGDIRPFLAGADIFVLSSLSEGVALTLLEAMASSLPVVATNVGGNREVVVPGETGLLVPARDPRALADGMLQLLADPERARRMGTAGRLRVEHEFAEQATVDAYESLYLELLRRRLGAERVA